MSTSSFPKVIGGGPTGSPYVWTVDFTTTVNVSSLQDLGATYLIDLDVYTGDTAGSSVKPKFLGSGPIGSALGFGSTLNPGISTLHYSDTGWIGEPEDELRANVLYFGRLAAPHKFSRSFSIFPEQERRIAASYGSIEIMSLDGATIQTETKLDFAIDQFAIAGRNVSVRRGRRKIPTSEPFKNFVTILNGVAVGWASSDEAVTLDVRDKLGPILDLPLQASMYLGTGGEEGTTDFTGKPKPICFGEVRNIVPDLIDPFNLVYKVHDGKIQSILSVRDRGVTLASMGQDYPTYQALTNSTIQPGKFATCLALGLFRINFLNQSGYITCDAQGDSYGGYVSTHGQIAQKILSTRSAVDSNLISAATFDALPEGVAGFHFPGDNSITIAQALDTIMASCFAWWGSHRDSTIVAGRLINPVGQVPIAEYDITNIRSDVTELNRPGIPRYRQRVGYEKLGTIQTGDNLAGSVSDTLRQYYSNEYRTATALDYNVQARYLNAEDPSPLVTGFKNIADAQTLAGYILTLFKVDRRVFSFTVGPEAYTYNLGDVVQLTYPRFNLQSGRNFIIVGLDEDRDDVTLTVWG